jgi:hypothetical protein
LGPLIKPSKLDTLAKLRQKESEMAASQPVTGFKGLM